MGLVGRMDDGPLRRVVAGPFEVDLGVHGAGETRSRIRRGVDVWRVEERKERRSRGHGWGRRTRYGAE